METYVAKLSHLIGGCTWLYGFTVTHLELVDVLIFGIDTHSRGHVTQLDALITLLKGGPSEYNKEYNPATVEILKIVTEIAQEKRDGRYSDKETPYILQILGDLKKEFRK